MIYPKFPSGQERLRQVLLSTCELQVPHFHGYAPIRSVKHMSHNSLRKTQSALRMASLESYQVIGLGEKWNNGRNLK